MMAKSYSVQYIFSLLDRFSGPSKKMAGSAKKLRGGVHAAGKGANFLTSALGRLSKVTSVASKKTTVLTRTTRTTAGATSILAKGAKAAAAGVGLIGKAASGAIAPLKALQAQMAKASAMKAATLAHVRNQAPYGYWETKARGAGMSPATIAMMRKRDAAMAKQLKRRSRGGVFGRGGMLRGRLGHGGRGALYMAGGGPGTMGALGGGYGAFSLLRSFADFEAAELEARAIGKRLGQSTTDLNKMLKQARKLGASTMFEPQDILGGHLLFLKAGRTAMEAMTALPSTLNLAAVSGQEVSTTTNQVLNMMAQAKIPAEKVGAVTDALYASFINAKAELPELASAASYAMMQLHGAGIGYEQAFGMLAAASQGGQTASRGGRAIAMTMAKFAKMQNPSKKEASVLKRAGLDLNKYFNKGRIRSFEHFTALLEKMAEIHKRDATILPELFPQNATRGMQAMLMNLDTYKRVIDAVQKSRGSNMVGEDAAVRFKGLSGAVRQLGAAWSELGIAFGKSGTGQLVERAIRGVTEAFNSMSTALDAGAFLEQLFDPVMLLGRIGILSNRLGVAIARGLMGAVQTALNITSEALGAGRLGDWFRDWLDFDEAMARVEERMAQIDKKLGKRADYINERSRAASWLGQTRLMQKRHGVFSRDSYGKFIAGIDFGNLPEPAKLPPPSFRYPSGAQQRAAGATFRQPQTYMSLPEANPNRIPEAAAERIKIESQVKVDTTFQPATVNVTGQVDASGLIRLQGQGQVKANRGQTSPEAGTTPDYTAP